MLYNLIMKNNYDVIIIGGGPAGLSAAIYTSRANLSVLVIEAESNGGKLSKIHSIENYPGIPMISGLELSNNLINHAKSYNAQILNGLVEKIEDHKVILSDKTEYTFKALIIATGSKERRLNLEHANEFTGRGISYCATCDGFFFRNKPVCVIGDNNNALEESLYLANLASKVTIVIKRDKLTGEEVLIDKILNNPKIEVITNSTPQSLLINDDKITGLTINKNSENITIECLGIFPYISYNPSTDFIDPILVNDKGFIITDKDMKTKINGIYAAGDCIEKDLRQVVTACSDGAIAASSIIKYLK